MRLERPWRWLFDQIYVHDHIKAECLGSITFKFSIVTRELKVMNAFGETLYLITSPRCQSLTFFIHTAVGTRVGEIRKRSRRHGAHIDADVGITFPNGASPAHKALLLGAGFLIDYTYFEEKSLSNDT
jgi:hypothetical protein